VDAPAAVITITDGSKLSANHDDRTAAGLEWQIAPSAPIRPSAVGLPLRGRGKSASILQE
jgi:hypothetical protein